MRAFPLITNIFLLPPVLIIEKTPNPLNLERMGVSVNVHNQGKCGYCTYSSSMTIMLNSICCLYKSFLFQSKILNFCSYLKFYTKNVDVKVPVDLVAAQHLLSTFSSSLLWRLKLLYNYGYRECCYSALNLVLNPFLSPLTQLVAVADIYIRTVHSTLGVAGGRL